MGSPFVTCAAASKDSVIAFGSSVSPIAIQFFPVKSVIFHSFSSFFSFSPSSSSATHGQYNDHYSCREASRLPFAVLGTFSEDPDSNFAVQADSAEPPQSG